jgi:hypothetical protein
MPRKNAKRKNGQGCSITVNFNQNDPQEAAALAMSQRLAGLKKGKRKDFIIAVLAAAERIYQDTGQLLDTYEITSALLERTPTNTRAPVGFPAATGQIVASDASAEQRRSGRQYADNTPGVKIVASGGKASARTVADNFLRSFSGQFFD